MNRVETSLREAVCAALDEKRRLRSMERPDNRSDLHGSELMRMPQSGWRQRIFRSGRLRSTGRRITRIRSGYAYSAYGSPIFMNGTGTVQSASAIGFETLYAGYRWDGTTPQMYYVRNRFLLPMIGTWNRRDPLGYVDGMQLYCSYLVLNATDPHGLWFGDGQNHHWIDKPHVGNLADLCGDLLEAAFLTADVLRDMLTTWVPGGFGKGEPHYDIHNSIDDVSYRDKLDDIFRESENCCEAMIRLRTLIQDTWRELTLGEGAQGPVTPPEYRRESEDPFGRPPMI